MPSDLRIDALLIGALGLALTPILVTMGGRDAQWLCTRDGGQKRPGDKAPAMPLGCHACTLGKERGDDDDAGG